jgi:hypothetical protein
MADGLGVTRLAVAAAVQHDLLRRRRQRAHLAPSAQLTDNIGQHVTVELHVGHAVAEGQQVPDAALDVELPGHVGPGHPQLPRRGHEATQRVAGTDDEVGVGIRVADVAAVVGVDCDGKVIAEDLFDHRRQAHGQPPSRNGWFHQGYGRLPS